MVKGEAKSTFDASKSPSGFNPDRRIPGVGLISRAGLQIINVALKVESLPKPIMDLTPETQDKRFQVFTKDLEELKKKHNTPNAHLVTPCTAAMLSAKYGQDIIQQAIDQGIIDIG